MFRLDTKVKSLNRVGEATARQLAKLGVFTIEDLIHFYPFRYEDYSKLKKIEELVPNEMVTIAVEIDLIEAKVSPARRMKMTEAVVRDESDSISIIWFNQPFVARQLRPGDKVYISGKPILSQYGLQFNNPSYEKISSKTLHTGQISPIYHSSGKLTQKQLRFLTDIAVKHIDQLAEWMPKEIRSNYKLIGFHDALKNIHFPDSQKSLNAALRRLQFNELFLIMLQATQIKNYLSIAKAKSQIFRTKEIKEFVDSLPFILTADQKSSAWQILQDIQKDKPMNRMLEGDVGSGKTVVSAMAMYNTILNKQQSVLMSPTSVLAHQHYDTFLELFKDMGVAVGLFTQARQEFNGRAISRDDLIGMLQSGEVQIVVGTHALIGDALYYNDLGIVVIDEQHRFGVTQRKILKDKNLSKTMPHFLSMSATPIPRSLALIVYGDLDLSLIKEKPKGRKDVETKVISENGRKQAYSFMRKQIDNGRQVFVICPLIDPSDKLGVKSVTDEFRKLDKEVFPDLSIGLLHGRLKSAEKDQVMRDFKDNTINILVSTSVIEVGVDIPNATIMMIEGAERFGLAQLHQFRGRVGRGEEQSYCYLFPSIETTPQAMTRLSAMEKTNDGFMLAEYDLKTRGPGEVYGVRQSGIPELRLARIDDLELIEKAKGAVEQFLEANNLEDFPLLESRVKLEIEKIHLE